MRWFLIVLALGIGAAGARAEMSGDDYASETVLRSEAERAEWHRGIESARRQEAETAERREREQAAALAERLAREDAARSPGERLVRQHCLACHAAGFIGAERRSSAGWWLVVLRMRAWNNAPIPFEAMPDLVTHLAATQPTTHTHGLAATLLLTPVVVLALIAACWRVGRRARRNRG